jgi:hypothetical protein
MSYQERVAKLAALLPDQGVFEIEVLHDLDCRLLASQGREACTCEPDLHVIELLPPDK